MPIKVLDVKDGAFCADAMVVPVGQLLHTTQTGSHATGHAVFQRCLAIQATLDSQACHSLHHGTRSAGVYHRETGIARPDAVLGDKALFALAAVFCGYQHTAYLTESIEPEQLSTRTCTQQERGLYALRLPIVVFLCRINDWRCKGTK